MKLYFTPFSPFARKCRVVILEKGLEKRVELVESPPMENGADLLSANPLATVPALVMDDGRTLCESPVICEYLDSLGTEASLYPAGKARFDALGLAALADGILAASVSCVLEGRRPENQRSPEWIIRKENAVRRTIAAIAGQKLDTKNFHIGVSNTVIALNYASFRQPHIDWRSEHSQLAGWYDEWSKRPSLASTAPTA